MSPSHSTVSAWSLTMGLIFLVGVALVVANPLASTGNDSNDEPASADISSNDISADMSRGSSLSHNPLLDKALQRASFRLSQLQSDDYLNALRDRIFLVRPFNRYPYTRKRSCFINAGMGNNCDFKDLISAASARRIWQSPNSPGKRSVSASLLPSAASMSDLLNTYYASALPAVYVANQALPDSKQSGPIYQYASGDLDQVPIDSQQSQVSPVKRMQCISGLPGGDCENSFLGGESLGQDFLRPGGRNPGRR